MGLPWASQVRCLYLAFFALAMIPVFLFFSYLNGGQLNTTMFRWSPVKWYDHTSQPDKGVSAGPSASASFPTNCYSNSQKLDLVEVVAVENIYEAGQLEGNLQICPNLGGNLKLLIAITSEPSHKTARLAVRETWGHFALRKDVAIAFMLGVSSNQTVNENLKQEQEIFDDIIQGKFIDTYNNLTLKTISIMEWVHKFCPKARFVLKTDDDMFINVSRLLAFIAEQKSEHRKIYGRLASKWKPVRNRKSKYYISTQQYKPAVFPDFTAGPAYLFPAELTRDLYVAAMNYTYVKLEDVFITGIVADGLNITRVHAPEFLNKRGSLTPCNIQKEISIHSVKTGEQYDLWKKLHDSIKCKK